MNEMSSFDNDSSHVCTLKERIRHARDSNPESMFARLGEKLLNSGAIDEDEETCSRFLSSITQENIGTFFTALNSGEYSIVNPGYVFLCKHIDDPKIQWKDLISFSNTDLAWLDFAIDTLGVEDGLFITKTFLCNCDTSIEGVSRDTLLELKEIVDTHPELPLVIGKLRWIDVVYSIHAGLSFECTINVLPKYNNVPIHKAVLAIKLGLNGDINSYDTRIMELAVEYNQELDDVMCDELSKFVKLYSDNMSILYLFAKCGIRFKELLKLNVSTSNELLTVANRLNLYSTKNIDFVKALKIESYDQCYVYEVLFNSTPGDKLFWYDRVFEQRKITPLMGKKSHGIRDISTLVIVCNKRLAGIWPISDLSFALNQVFGDTTGFVYRVYEDTIIIGDKTSVYAYKNNIRGFGDKGDKLLQCYKISHLANAKSVESFCIREYLKDITEDAESVVNSVDAWEYFKLLCLQHDNSIWFSLASRNDMGLYFFQTYAPVSYTKDNVYKILFRHCCSEKHSVVIDNTPDDFPRYVKLFGKVYDLNKVSQGNNSLQITLKYVNIRKIIINSEYAEVLDG